MQYKSEEALAKAIKEGTGHRAWLLYGSERYLVEQWSKQLIGADQDRSPFNLHRFDGRNPDLEALYEAVEALPLMSAEKKILLEDLDWGKMPAPDQAALEEIVSDLPDDCVLVVTTGADFEEKTAASKKLIGLFDRAGCAVRLEARDRSGKSAFLKKLAKQRGCTLSTELCRLILDLCETDMHSLHNEVEKICSYAGSGEITEQQIREVATVRTEAKIFDLSSAVLSGNAQKAMELLDSLFYLRESAVSILSVLIRAFVDLYRARTARSLGKTPSDLIGLFSYKRREFVVERAFRDSSRLSDQTVVHMLEILSRCDRNLKSTGSDDRIQLEQAVTELLIQARSSSYAS